MGGLKKMYLVWVVLLGDFNARVGMSVKVDDIMFSKRQLSVLDGIRYDN